MKHALISREEEKTKNCYNYLQVHMKSVSTTSVLSTVSVHEIKYYTERLIYYGNSEGDDRTLTAYSQTGKVFH